MDESPQLQNSKINKKGRMRFMMLQGKYFITLMDVLDHIFRSVGVCVADKDLAKIIILDQPDNMGHPVFVQLVKNIIQ